MERSIFRREREKGGRKGGKEGGKKSNCRTIPVPSFMLKLKQYCYLLLHTHISLYLSSIGSISCKVVKVFRQMLSTWKMFNKWWLLFPCASKIWEPLRIVLCGK